MSQEDRVQLTQCDLYCLREFLFATSHLEWAWAGQKLLQHVPHLRVCQPDGSRAPQQDRDDDAVLLLIQTLQESRRRPAAKGLGQGALCAEAQQLPEELPIQ